MKKHQSEIFGRAWSKKWGLIAVRSNFWGSDSHSFTFCFPHTEDTAAIDQDDIILKLPDPVVAGSSRRIVTDFVIHFLGYTVN
jgi:hypothetical protein